MCALPDCRFVPRIYTHYISTLLFFFFGLRMLWEAQGMASDEGAEELEEVTQELKKSDDEKAPTTGRRFGIFSPIFIQVGGASPPLCMRAYPCLQL